MANSSQQPGRIQIVGGGLAGLCLGCGLSRRGIAVDVFDSGTLPRHRVCGEFIAGVGGATLEKLGIEKAFAGAVRQRTYAWWVGGRRVLRGRLPTEVPGLSRYFLDQYLAETLEINGGRWHPGQRIDRETARDPGWVWAAGREARRTDWRGYKAHYRGLELGSDLEVHLGRGGYIGMSAVEGGAINVCGLVRDPQVRVRTREAVPAMARILGLGYLVDRLESAERLEGSESGIAGFDPHWTVPDDALVRIGDALTVIPPFTGNGMSMAFEAAAVAIEPLEDYARGSCEWEEARRRVRSRQLRLFRTRLRVARCLHPLLMRPRTQMGIGWAARGGLLPFRWLYRLTH